MTVINGDGLVGRVKSVTARTATVLLLERPERRPSACASRATVELGLARGAGLRSMSWR